MMLLSSSIQGISEFIGLIFILIIVLLAAYFTSRYIGKVQGTMYKNKNITVVETYKVVNNKFIQIIRIGNKYIAVAVGKEEINFLTEVEEEELILLENKSNEPLEFKEIFNKIKLGKKDNDDSDISK